jgi:Cu/Ag efflux protein CusF
MKTTTSHGWMAVCASVLTAASVATASADQAATAAKPEKNYTGTVVSVNPNEHTLDVKGFLFSKKFNLGANCTYALLEKPAGTVSDLRLGEKIAINYQDASGVLVADRVTQEPMDYEGMVTAIDPDNRKMTVHIHGMDKKFQIPDNCAVVLRNDKSGTLADIQVGNHVTVTYETPNDMLTARQIAQTSATFTGMLTAIDLGDRTVKAKTLFDTKKFNLADNCAIVLNGKPDGQLSDLRPDEQLEFSYDDVNGVNVVNRIADTKSAPQAVTAQQ